MGSDFMKYFVCDNERKGTCYHEFYKGKWDEKTFWKEDSIFLHDDIMFENKGFVDAIVKAVPTYAKYGVTEISLEEWEKIGLNIMLKDEISQEIYCEADIWVKEVFKEYECFTILGI